MTTVNQLLCKVKGFSIFQQVEVLHNEIISENKETAIFCNCSQNTLKEKFGNREIKDISVGKFQVLRITLKD